MQSELASLETKSQSLSAIKSSSITKVMMKVINYHKHFCLILCVAAVQTWRDAIAPALISRYLVALWGNLISDKGLFDSSEPEHCMMCENTGYSLTREGQKKKKNYKYNETSKTWQQRVPLRFGLFASLLKEKKPRTASCRVFFPFTFNWIDRWIFGRGESMLIQYILH